MPRHAVPNKISLRLSAPYLKSTTLAMLLLLLLLLSPLNAAQIEVPRDFTSIQAAINAADDDDEIIVSPGTYYENLNFFGKDLILRSVDPTNATVVVATIINGSGLGPVVTFTGAESDECLLSGFTITNGSATNGGGILGNASEATIQYNQISGNSAASQGGGLYFCNGLIQSNIITGNGAGQYGGALSFCLGTIENNMIYANNALYGGGLCYCHETIRNNTITANGAASGGGLYGCGATIRNCIIWDNSATTYPQLYGSSGPTYSCIQDWVGGQGNIPTDPLFVDPANNDFHLHPASPCIDAGGSVSGLTLDFEGDPRPFEVTAEPRGDGSNYDIGADEYFIHPTFDFEGSSQGWQFYTPLPGPEHYSHWADASAISDPHALGISSPYDESTNYFALWDSANSPIDIPYQELSVYQADWYFSTNRQTTNAVPSVRFRFALDNNKAFAYSRIYPGGWLPLAARPSATGYQLYFEPPITAGSLYLAFSLIDWVDDFRGTAPAGELYLEQIYVFRYNVTDLAPWNPVAEFSGSQFNSWTLAYDAHYTSPTFTRETDGSLSLTSGVDDDQVFGSWNSPASLFSLPTNALYRVTCNLSSDREIGGPELRLRIHSNDYRYSWYTHYLGGWSAGDSATPPAVGADYYLYLTLPFATQPCRFSFDLIDFSTSFGGTLTLHNFSLHSHPF